MRARRIKSFCEGAKTMLFKGKRPPPVWSKAHSAPPTRCGFSREPRPCGLRRAAHPRSDAAPPRARALQPTHPLNSPAHSAPAILLSVGRACPRPPQAGYVRNVQSSTQNKKPSAEFALRANNCNKIPSEGVYLGGNSQFSPNTERLAIGQPFRVKSSRCAARIRARRGRRRRCRSRRC